MPRTPSQSRNLRRWMHETSSLLPTKPARATQIARVLTGEAAESDLKTVHRNLNGKTLPDGDRLYSYGEAFVAAGIEWSSGLYALFQHDTQYTRVYNVLDLIAKQRELVQPAWAWLRIARLNMRNEALLRNGSPADDMSIFRALLIRATDSIRSATATAWQKEKGIDEGQAPRGIFSQAHDIFVNPHTSGQRILQTEDFVVRQIAKIDPIMDDLQQKIIAAESRVTDFRLNEMLVRMRGVQDKAVLAQLESEYEDVIMAFEVGTETLLNPGPEHDIMMQQLAQLPPLPDNFPLSAECIVENGKIRRISLWLK